MVTEYENDIIPTEEEKQQIIWQLFYRDDNAIVAVQQKGKDIFLFNTGQHFIESDNFVLYAYFKDKGKEGKIDLYTYKEGCSELISGGEYVASQTESNVFVKLTNLGQDENIAFIHYLSGENAGDTKIINLDNNNTNWIKNGIAHIKGFIHRDYSVNWENIFDEWKKGEGYTNSLFYGRNHPMNKQIMKSNSFNDARNTFVEATKRDKTLMKKYIQKNFGVSDLFLAGKNMTMQMIGSYGISFYEIGEYKRLVMITDNKTRESFYYHGLYLVEVENIERTSTYGGERESTTNQTYIWVDYNENNF